MTEGDVDAVREARRRVQEEYGELFDRVSAVLFEEDPIGINFESNTDEYAPEAGTIIPRLAECDSAADAHRMIHEEFIRWFDLSTAGAFDRYLGCAERIWALWSARG